MKKLFIITAIAGLLFVTNSACAADAPAASKPAPAATTAPKAPATPAKEAVATDKDSATTAADAAATETARCDVPKNFIDSLNKIVVDTVADTKLSDAQKTEHLSDMFRDYVNIQWIGRFVLAQNWRSLKPAQQTEYLQAYENYLLRTYIPIFKEYKDVKVEFLSATPLKNPAEYMVATRVVRVDEPEIQISYRIKKDASCFKVYDMVAEGVSMLNTQRQDFTSIFANNGYKELVRILKSKVGDPTPDAKK